MLARRFLLVIAALIVLVIAAAVVYRLFGGDLLRLATVPTIRFADSPVPPPPNYRQISGWLAQPRLYRGPAHWTPPGHTAAPQPGAAVFFVPTTSYIGRDRWTMPLSDADTDARAARFLRDQASVFNGVGEIWAPRYRQASFGAFLTSSPDALRALDFAYADVLRAFDVFVQQVPSDAPIILAGHGQGARHLLRLLKDRVAGTRLQQRIVAAYVIGWPVSVAADLPAAGLPACTAPGAAGCIVSFSSFAEPADVAPSRKLFDASPSLTSQSHRGTAIVCTNPLAGASTAAAVPPVRNIGALVPDTSTLVPRGVGARCMADGWLSIGPPPARFGQYVLPGNNYHLYDYQLFWANLRADAEARTSAFGAK